MKDVAAELAPQDTRDSRPRRRAAGTDPTVRTAAVVAGAGILLIAALAAFGIFGVIERLVVDGDAAATATAIAGSEGL